MKKPSRERRAEKPSDSSFRKKSIALFLHKDVISSGGLSPTNLLRY